MLAFVSGSRAQLDRCEHPRPRPERRGHTRLKSWLRQYGPIVGMALMGLSAAAVVLSALLLTGSRI